MGDVGEDVDEKFAGFVEAAGSVGVIKGIIGSEEWRVEKVGNFTVIVRGGNSGVDLDSLIPPEVHSIMDIWISSGGKDDVALAREVVRKNEWRRDVLERRRSEGSEVSFNSGVMSLGIASSVGSNGNSRRQD